MGWLESLFGNADAADRAGGSSGLHSAAQAGDARRVLELIRRGANVNQTSAQDGATPLHYAAERGHLDAACALLDHGAQVDAQAGPHPTQYGPVGQGSTPLIFAATEGHPEMVELLLDHGATIDMTNIDGRATALFLAAQRGRTGAVAALLRRGADARLATDRGVLPLHIAAERGHLEVAKLLLAHGSPVDISTPYNRDSPLHDAAQNGHDEIVALLLDRGADPSHVDRMGNTPLHVASHSGHAAVVRRLVAHGADPTIKNAAGYSAEDLACEGPGANESEQSAIIAALRAGMRRTR
jgi:ankyrin repeat protein